jgi:hypothetical protein
MANDTPRIIQKDLGLVTAYGYALAGGYEGTEQQFIEDFAKLMQGRMHNDYTFTTIAEMNAAIQAGQIEDGATIYCKEEKGTINNEVRQEDISDLFTAYDDCCTPNVYSTDCGNITFISLQLYLAKTITIPYKSDYAFISALDLDYETYSYLEPCILDKFFGNQKHAEIIGYSADPFQLDEYYPNSMEVKRNTSIQPYVNISHNFDNSINIKYVLRNQSREDVTITKSAKLIIDHFFINRKSVPAPFYNNGG